MQVLLPNKNVKTLHNINPIPIPRISPLFCTITAVMPAPKIKIGITLQQNIKPISPIIAAIVPPIPVIVKIFLSILKQSKALHYLTNFFFILFSWKNQRKPQFAGRHSNLIHCKFHGCRVCFNKHRTY